MVDIFIIIFGVYYISNDAVGYLGGKSIIKFYKKLYKMINFVNMESYMIRRLILCSDSFSLNWSPTTFRKIILKNLGRYTTENYRQQPHPTVRKDNSYLLRKLLNYVIPVHEVLAAAENGHILIIYAGFRAFLC